MAKANWYWFCFSFKENVRYSFSRLIKGWCLNKINIITFLAVFQCISPFSCFLLYIEQTLQMLARVVLWRLQVLRFCFTVCTSEHWLNIACWGRVKYSQHLVMFGCPLFTAPLANTEAKWKASCVGGGKRLFTEFVGLLVCQVPSTCLWLGSFLGGGLCLCQSCTGVHRMRKLNHTCLHCKAAVAV